MFEIDILVYHSQSLIGLMNNISDLSVPVILENKKYFIKKIFYKK